jgi:hypothetical protein
VRVLLDADGPEDYEPALEAFEQANKTAIEQVPGEGIAPRGGWGWSLCRARYRRDLAGCLKGGSRKAGPTGGQAQRGRGPRPGCG